MKKQLTFLCLFILSLSIDKVFSLPLYSASVQVYNQAGQPMAGVPVRMELHTTSAYEWDVRTTDSNGYVYIPLAATGFLDYMFVTISGQNYEILSSQGTFTVTGFNMYPTFNVMLDINGNDIADEWEMALAQKFCPVLFAPIEDRGLPFGGGLTTLRPVPVEIMDIDGPGGQPDGILDYHDVEVSVYATAGNGAVVGIYDMEELTVFGTPYSNRYPDIILPFEIRNTTPPGKAYGSYVLVPQYEWATSNVPEDNAAWYSHWEQKVSEHSGDTWYEDGTTYVAFDKNGSNTRINYLFHYPFNASAGRHEGDLPTIRVTLSSQNPNTASIISVSYPIHGIGSVRTIKVDYNQSLAESFAGQTFNDDGNGNPAFANKFFAIGQTHPVSFGGGYLLYDGVWGFGSHANTLAQENGIESKV